MKDRGYSLYLPEYKRDEVVYETTGRYSKKGYKRVFITNA
jgi:hypothetical protein